MNFCVQFGGEASGVAAGNGHGLQLSLAMPCLGGSGSERWPFASDPDTVFTWQQVGNWHVGTAGDLMWLCAAGNADDATLEAVTGDLYCELLAVLGREWQLQRIWHYLPRINEPGAGGLERYRAFCSGRSRAFEMTFGADFQKCLPAASAVGCEGAHLVIYGCARRNAQVNYFENPLQTPAYRYSQAYGPRAPGFARASLTRIPGMARPHGKAQRSKECSEIYLSGTASIRDERSLVEGGLPGQFEITVANLNRIAAECGLDHFLQKETDGDGLPVRQPCGDSPPGGDAPLPVRRRFKVYLRHAGDYPLIRARFNALLGADDAVIYLRSDICRAELDLEIEASVLLGNR